MLSSFEACCDQLRVNYQNIRSHFSGSFFPNRLVLTLTTFFSESFGKRVCFSLPYLCLSNSFPEVWRNRCRPGGMHASLDLKEHPSVGGRGRKTFLGVAVPALCPRGFSCSVRLSSFLFKFRTAQRWAMIYNYSREPEAVGSLGFF